MDKTRHVYVTKLYQFIEDKADESIERDAYRAFEYGIPDEHLAIQNGKVIVR